jgi:drug/metabolite transporter (DMT)-like permease
VIGFVLLWNSGFIGAEYALPYAAPFTLLFWRYWALTLILVLYLAGRKRLKWPGLKSVLIAFATGILAHGVWLGCVMFALQKGIPAGIVALVVSLQPMVTGALSGWTVGEKTSISRWIGLVIGFAGVAIAVFGRTSVTNMHAASLYMLPLGSVVAITVASLIQRKVQVSNSIQGLSIETGLFYQSLGTALTVTIPAVFIEGLATEWTLSFLGTMCWLVAGVSLAAYALMWLLINRMEVTRVASLFYFGPPVTMLMAWVALNDTIKVSDISALFIVALGVVITQKTGTGKLLPRG